ncbi:hypothetical protein GYMLUDRAFT_54856 [Collybiopsis luxurians FD-317 M1]|nr:hypothetical protein GYMLUDRAFT_54856 [Collybiopsis luxurians FD-317 M1]
MVPKSSNSIGTNDIDQLPANVDEIANHLTVDPQQPLATVSIPKTGTSNEAVASSNGNFEDFNLTAVEYGVEILVLLVQLLRILCMLASKWIDELEKQRQSEIQDKRTADSPMEISASSPFRPVLSSQPENFSVEMNPPPDPPDPSTFQSQGFYKAFCPPHDFTTFPKENQIENNHQDVKQILVMASPFARMGVPQQAPDGHVEQQIVFLDSLLICIRPGEGGGVWEESTGHTYAIHIPDHTTNDHSTHHQIPQVSPSQFQNFMETILAERRKAQSHQTNASTEAASSSNQPPASENSEVDKTVHVTETELEPDDINDEGGDEVDLEGTTLEDMSHGLSREPMTPIIDRQSESPVLFTGYASPMLSNASEFSSINISIDRTFPVTEERKHMDEQVIPDHLRTNTFVESVYDSDGELVYPEKENSSDGEDSDEESLKGEGENESCKQDDNGIIQQELDMGRDTKILTPIQIADEKLNWLDESQAEETHHSQIHDEHHLDSPSTSTFQSQLTTEIAHQARQFVQETWDEMELTSNTSSQPGLAVDDVILLPTNLPISGRSIAVRTPDRKEDNQPMDLDEQEEIKSAYGAFKDIAFHHRFHNPDPDIFFTHTMPIVIEKDEPMVSDPESDIKEGNSPFSNHSSMPSLTSVSSVNSNSTSSEGDISDDMWNLMTIISVWNAPWKHNSEESSIVPMELKTDISPFPVMKYSTPPPQK